MSKETQDDTNEFVDPEETMARIRRQSYDFELENFVGASLNGISELSPASIGRHQKNIDEPQNRANELSLKNLKSPKTRSTSTTKKPKNER